MRYAAKLVTNAYRLFTDDDRGCHTEYPIANRFLEIFGEAPVSHFKLAFCKEKK